MTALNGFEPTTILSRRVSDDDVVRTAQLIEIAQRHTLKEFVSVPSEAFTVSVLSGGITNQLYRVSAPLSASTSASVVLRVFGKETERIISRESELFYQAIFLRTYCQGDNFLAYEFLDGYKDIAFSEMSQLRRPIAAALANFHFRATLSAKQSAGGLPSRYDREPFVARDNLKSWWRQALGTEVQSKLSEAQKAVLNAAGITEGSVEGVIRRLDAELNSRGQRLVAGVCHNDLLCANIMRDLSHTNDEHLALIDFEYACKNFLLFDFANHFNEYCGLECNYDVHFPSDEVMLDTMLTYRQSMRCLLKGAAEGGDANQPFSESESSAFGFSTSGAPIIAADGVFSGDSELEICRMWVCDVKLLSLVSHAIWTAWSILQAAHSVIDFDFASYATQRWRRLINTIDAFTSQQ